MSNGNVEHAGALWDVIEWGWTILAPAMWWAVRKIFLLDLENKVMKAEISAIQSSSHESMDALHREIESQNKAQNEAAKVVLDRLQSIDNHLRNGSS